METFHSTPFMLVKYQSLFVWFEAQKQSAKSPIKYAKCNKSFQQQKYATYLLTKHHQILIRSLSINTKHSP